MAAKDGDDVKKNVLKFYFNAPHDDLPDMVIEVAMAKVKGKLHSKSIKFSPYDYDRFTWKAKPEYRHKEFLASRKVIPNVHAILNLNYL